MTKTELSRQSLYTQILNGFYMTVESVYAKCFATFRGDLLQYLAKVFPPKRDKNRNQLGEVFPALAASFM